MAAKKKTRVKAVIKKSTPDELAFAALFAVAAIGADVSKRHNAQDIIRRAALAAAAQSKAETAYQRWLDRASADGTPGPTAALARAQQETDKAGAALAKALRALRGAK